MCCIAESHSTQVCNGDIGALAGAGHHLPSHQAGAMVQAVTALLALF